MIKLDEDALICDFAETYGILDFRSLPLKLAATLAMGLRDDSRIKMKIAGIPIQKNTLLLAGISDRLTAMAWKDKKRKPVYIIDSLFNKDNNQDEKKTEMLFNSGDDFRREWERIQRKAVQ